MVPHADGPLQPPGLIHHPLEEGHDHGWTTPANAAGYQRLLTEEIFPGIAARGVRGYRGIQLLRQDFEDEVEFKTIMWFDSWEAVREFAGEDHENAYVPPEARAVLSRFDTHARHYEGVVVSPSP